MSSTYKYQVEKLNEWGANPNSTKILGKQGSTNNTGNFGTILDMIISGLNSMSVCFNQTSTTNSVLPSATSNTYGTAYVIVPAVSNASTAVNAANFQTAGASGLSPLQATFTIANIGSETVTTQITATYNDGSTVAVATKTTTTNQTLTYALADMATLFVGGKYIVSLSCAVKSSISSSTATATVNAFGDSFTASVQIPALV